MTIFHFVCKSYGCLLLYSLVTMQLADFRPTRYTVVQFLEYLVGGTIYFWSGYLVFALCYSILHWNWLYAKLVADAVGWTLNYLVQRYWAFNSPQLQKRDGVTAGKYAVITIANFGIDYLIIWGLNTVGISPYIGFFISSGFFTAWNYIWYRFWVFIGQPKHKSVERI
jgi:putative flippase GtrA